MDAIEDPNDGAVDTQMPWDKAAGYPTPPKWNILPAVLKNSKLPFRRPATLMTGKPLTFEPGMPSSGIDLNSQPAADCEELQEPVGAAPGEGVSSNPAEFTCPPVQAERPTEPTGDTVPDATGATVPDVNQKAADASKRGRPKGKGKAAAGTEPVKEGERTGRASDWTHEEVLALVEIYGPILEEKHTTGLKGQKRFQSASAVWSFVAEELAKKTGVSRPKDSVSSKWENLSTSWRKVPPSFPGSIPLCSHILLHKLSLSFSLPLSLYLSLSHSFSLYLSLCLSVTMSGWQFVSPS